MKKRETVDQSRDPISSRISRKWEQKIARRKILKTIRRKFPGAKERHCLHIERVYPLSRIIKKDPPVVLSLIFQNNKDRQKTLKVFIKIYQSSKRNGNQMLHQHQWQPKDSTAMVFKVLRENGFEPRILLLQNKLFFGHQGLPIFTFLVTFLMYLLADEN